MGQGKSVPRVSGGVPWWLWLVAIVVTAAVVLGILLSQEEDSLDVVFDRAVTAADQREVDVFNESFEEFRRRGGSNDRIGVLEGIRAGATNRLPRSIKLLEPYLNHSDQQLQALAVKHSGINHQRLGDADAARLMYLKCIELAPEDVRPRRLLVGLYMAAGAYGPAAELAEEILELDPKDQSALDSIVTAQVATGRINDAIEVYQSHLETERDRVVASPDFVAGYLDCLRQTGQADTALQFLEDNETLVIRSVLRARIYLSSNQLDELDKILNVSDEDEPTHQPAELPLKMRFEAARAMESGNWRQAISLLGQTILYLPRSSEVFEALKRAAVEDGDTDLVDACQANLDGLQEVQRRMQDAVKAVGSDMKDPQLRVDVAEIATELCLKLDREKWLQAAVNVASAEQLLTIEQQTGLTWPGLPLVPIPSAYGAAPTNDSSESTDAGNSDDAEPDSAAESSETSDSSSVEPAPAEPSETPTEESDNSTEPEDTTESSVEPAAE